MTDKQYEEAFYKETQLTDQDLDVLCVIEEQKVNPIKEELDREEQRVIRCAENLKQEIKGYNPSIFQENLKISQCNYLLQTLRKDYRIIQIKKKEHGLV